MASWGRDCRRLAAAPPYIVVGGGVGSGVGWPGGEGRGHLARSSLLIKVGESDQGQAHCGEEP